MNLTSTIKQLALDEGFDLVGVASRTQSQPELEKAIHRYSAWLQQGHGATMEYLSRHQPKKENPDTLLANWKSVIRVAQVYGDRRYDAPQTHPQLGPKTSSASASRSTQGQISIYTRGKDYHDILMTKLSRLSIRLSRDFKISSHPFVDAQPVLERFWAQQAGLGWIGKNTCLIHRKQGSYLFIGGLITTAELEPDTPDTDHCGKCRKCIDACPTQAIELTDGLFEGATFVDSRKCIGYHTIENREKIPEAVAQSMGRWIAGCDVCQQVCPWNDPLGKALALDPGLQAINPAYLNSDLRELAHWTEAEFKSKLQGFAMVRMKYTGFLRNLAIAISNSDMPSQQKQEALSQLEKHLTSLSPAHRGDSKGALGARAAIEGAQARLVE